MRARLSAVAGALFLLCLSPSVVQAAHAPPEHWLGLPIWVWGWANLVVFWGALIYFAGPALRSFLERRREGIRADLHNARRQRSEAEEMRAGLEQRVEELKGEMDRLIERGEQEGNREREEILEQARRECERVVEQTRDEIDNRVARARVELSQLTTRLAASIAERRISEQLTAEDRRRIFERNLDRLREEAS